MSDDSAAIPVVVLDTTTLVQSISTRGPFHRIIEAFYEGRLVLVVSHAILLEYEEVLRRIGGPLAWPVFEALLEARADSVRRANPTYSWTAIPQDPDDDKFVEAAVAKKARWIVTTDGHFDALKRQDLLAVRPIHPREFIDQYLTPLG
jgi:putative PIN family toxin of toxin-antitoxin system